MSTQAICRVCTEPTTPETSWNLFEPQAGADGLNLAQLVAAVGGIDVRPEEEGLPVWCCFQCQLDVGTAYRVRVLCQESDRKLREMLEASVVIEPVEGVEEIEIGPVCKMEVEEPAEGNLESFSDGVQIDCKEAEIPVLEEHCSNSTQNNQPYPVHLTRNDPAEKMRTKEKPKFKCNSCPKLLATQEARQFHEYFHLNPFGFKCPRCPEVFTNFYTYRTHSRIHRPPKGTIFNCGSCGEQFKHRSSLYKHVAKSCTSQKNKCDFCPASYACQYSLSRHVKKFHQGGPEIIRGEADEDFVQEPRVSEAGSQESRREAVMNESIELKAEDINDDAVCEIETRSPAEKVDEQAESGKSPSANSVAL